VVTKFLCGGMPFENPKGPKNGCVCVWNALPGTNQEFSHWTIFFVYLLTTGEGKNVVSCFIHV